MLDLSVGANEDCKVMSYVTLFTYIRQTHPIKPLKFVFGGEINYICSKLTILIFEESLSLYLS